MITNSAYAQLYIGPNVGIDYNSIKFGEKEYTDIIDRKPSIGYHAGISALFEFNKTVSVSAKLLYANKSRDVKLSATGLRIEERYGFIEFPLVLRYAIYRNPGWYYIGAGGHISYWLNGSGTFSEGELEDNGPVDFTTEFNSLGNEFGVMYYPNPNRLFAGLTLVAGSMFHMGYGQRIMIEAQFSLTQTFFSNESEGNDTKLLTFYDRTRVSPLAAGISISYLFDAKFGKAKKGKSTKKESNRRKRR
ncbi:outer membrane beta-barrel protein [Mangrovivirga sp. M17]|uniref:Outer membrane beta-barrel protein n=1 Tax=Mangrovivirga halotolerans TaxID=2993936 RepID=A0ABT3RWH2_9BACT|nr:outer membrane beta-barrel protein [Mangrovivirga halotolerans]MCX2746135.1 outer membrane beta-barrel protein [Mangrovivirga halotolerans]